MDATRQRYYFFASLGLHVAILLILILGYDAASPLIVVENTNKQDVISAVVLGDTHKSKIITPQAVKPTPVEEKIEPKPTSKAVAQPTPKEDVIALKPREKKKPKDIFGKDLLADLEKFKKKAEKQKKTKQQQLKQHFEKVLRQQAEQSMRQMLDDEIKLNGTQSRQSRGIVNKYQALIIQAVSEHWIIPPQSNKKRYALLMIRLAPSGNVLDVQVTKSSGDLALDNSARAAVLKASPLPVPRDPQAFEPFRQFTMKAKPENILDDASRVY